MEIVNKYFKNNTDWLAGRCRKQCYTLFTDAAADAKDFLAVFPNGVVERHICEHTTFKIWRAGDDFSTV